MAKKNEKNDLGAQSVKAFKGYLSGVLGDYYSDDDVRALIIGQVTVAKTSLISLNVAMESRPDLFSKDAREIYPTLMKALNLILLEMREGRHNGD